MHELLRLYRNTALSLATRTIDRCQALVDDPQKHFQSEKFRGGIFITWNLTKTATFSIRTTYNAKWQKRVWTQNCDGEWKGATNTNLVRDKVWKLHCPAKIKKNSFGELYLAPCHAMLHQLTDTSRCNRYAHYVMMGQKQLVCPLLFQCTKASRCGQFLGFKEAIEHACKIDHSRETILEFLRCRPHPSSSVLGLGKIDLLVHVGSWYLRCERKKLVHDDYTQTLTHVAMVVRALVCNYSMVFLQGFQ